MLTELLMEKGNTLEIDHLEDSDGCEDNIKNVSPANYGMILTETGPDQVAPFYVSFLEHSRAGRRHFCSFAVTGSL